MTERMRRAWAVITEVKAVETGDARIIEGVASTPSTDRMGDIVEPEGVVIPDHLPLLWQHDSLAPVGVVEKTAPGKKGIKFRARIAQVDGPPAMKARLDEAWQSVKAGLIRGVSIGFRAIETARLETGGLRFLKWDWLELSLVTVPANAEATITLIRSFDSDGSASGMSAAKTRPVVSLAEVPAIIRSPIKKGAGAMPSITEQKALLERQRADKAKRMEDLQAKVGEESRTKTAAEREEFDRLAEEIEALAEEIADLATLERASVTKAVPVSGKSAAEASASRAGREVESVRVINRVEEKGLGFARVAMCFAAAKGIPHVAAQIAEAQYGYDPRVAALCKTAVTGGATTDANWAGALSNPQDLVSEFLEFLRPMTILGKFGQNGVPNARRVPFNVKVNKQTTGQTGYWVGEGKPAPVTKGAFAQVTMGKTKLGAITVLTKEQMRFANIAAERIVRDDLAAAIVAKEDATFVSTAAAVSNVSPAGVLNGLTAIATAGATADAVRTDIQKLTEPFADVNIPDTDIVLITGDKLGKALLLFRNALGNREFPDVRRGGGTLEEFPLIVSNHVAPGDVIAISASSLLLADDDEVSLEMSDQASIEMDDAPTQSALTGGGASMVSMFQSGSVAIKAERFVNWQIGRTGGVQFIGAAGWNGAPSA